MTLTVLIPKLVFAKHREWFESALGGATDLPGMKFQGHRVRGAEELLVVGTYAMEPDESRGNCVLEMVIEGSKSLLFYGVFPEKMVFGDDDVAVNFLFEEWHTIEGRG